jgi:hypothetical protein
MIDGKIKQVLLAAREVDVNQVSDATRSSWPTRHLYYTHGYGVVMAEVNRTTEDGLPVLLIQDAPPEINVSDIQLTRPEIYYGEVTHEPVFVSTDQMESDRRLVPAVGRLDSRSPIQHPADAIHQREQPHDALP